MFTIRFKSLLIISLVFFIGLVQAQTIRDYIPDKTPDSRYTVNNSNSTVTDKRTNLMWKRCSEGLSGSDCSTGSVSSHNWQEALKIPENLNAGSGYAGFKDWRLPNIAELKSIVAYDRFDPAINETRFPNAGGSFNVWSSSPYAYAYAGTDFLVWTVIFSRGSDNFIERNNNGRVRLVRGGQ